MLRRPFFESVSVCGGGGGGGGGQRMLAISDNIIYCMCGQATCVSLSVFYNDNHIPLLSL